MRDADDHRCNRRGPWRSFERLFLLVAFLTIPAAARPAPVGNGGSGGPEVSWISDNGNGTFTNPLFYDEFSDPDVIRVGSDYYLTGTTMHVMPGLPVLHSKDLVNWEFLSYAVNRLDFGADYRLEGGKDAYGSGIWAPALRYHAGSYYIFANVNGHGTQVFRAKDPHGPWKQTSLGATLHDLSVLFDEDGRVYAVYGYGNVHLIELKPDLSGVIPDTDRIIIHEGSGVGEGHHFYKIQGKYVIISADYAPVGRMTASRADHIAVRTTQSLSAPARLWVSRRGGALKQRAIGQRQRRGSRCSCMRPTQTSLAQCPSTRAVSSTCPTVTGGVGR